VPKTLKSRAANSELASLRTRLAEAEATLKAIRSGDVDAIVVDGPEGSRIFTLQGPDDPYRMWVERMSEGAATLTPDGIILFCNRRLAEMVGRDPERLVGSTFKSTLDETEWSAFAELTQRALENDVRGMTHMLQLDGTTFPVQLSLSSILDKGSGQSICLVATDIREQKQAEQRALEQAALLNLTHDAIFVHDTDSRITFWNEGAVRRYGWTAAQAVGQITYDLLQTRSSQSIEQINAELLANNFWEGELVHTRADKSRITVDSRWALLRDSRGQPHAVLEINNDVSRRKESEEALQQSEEKLRILIDGVKDYAILLLDPEGRITTWNEGAARILGYRAEEITGEHFSTFYPVDALAKGQPALGLQIAKEQGRFEEENWRVRKDGSLFWASVTITPLYDKTGQIRGFGNVTRDITERRLGETKLQSLIDRLSLATVVAKAGVWEWELSSNTITWDATMFEIYGISRPPATSEDKWSRQMPYEQWASAVHPDDLRAAEEMLERTIKERIQGLQEFRVIRPDGAVRNILAMQTSVLDISSKVIRVVGVNTDITDRKEAEAAKEKKGGEQLKFKDDFLSHVSHELRTPLTAIKQFTDILLDGMAGDLTEDQSKYQRIVLKNILQLQSMIDDLLEVTRLESRQLVIEPRAISVSDVVADVIDSLRGSAEAKNVRLSCDMPSSLPTAYADPTRLGQVLIILIDNAVKFTPHGGAVHVRTRTSELHPGLILFEISDTGCGIAADKLTKVFERLYQVTDVTQSSRKGLGLGLFICQGLVTRQGGQIWVKSELTEGSTFSFTLPVFSLEPLIAPLLANNSWPAEALALITVEVESQGVWPSAEAREEWSREASRLVRGCMLPDRDVVLQETRFDGARERFFVAAFAEEKGISILTNRIRGQLGLLPHAKDQNISISHTMLGPIRPEAGVSRENMVTSLASHLEASIKFHNANRGNLL